MIEIVIPTQLTRTRLELMSWNVPLVKASSTKYAPLMKEKSYFIELVKTEITYEEILRSLETF